MHRYRCESQSQRGKTQSNKYAEIQMQSPRDKEAYAQIGSDHNGALFNSVNQVKIAGKRGKQKRIQMQTIGFHIQIATQNASKEVRYRDLGSDFYLFIIIIEHILYVLKPIPWK